MINDYNRDKFLHQMCELYPNHIIEISKFNNAALNKLALLIMDSNPSLPLLPRRWEVKTKVVFSIEYPQSSEWGKTKGATKIKYY